MASVDFTKLIDKIKQNYKSIIGAVLVLLVGGLLGAGATNITMKPSEDGKTTEVVIENSFSMELSEDQKPALVETEEGTIVEVSAPTVEEIDGNQLIEQDESKIDLGQGAYYDVSSPQAFRDSVYGRCIDVDGLYGAQCVDLYAAFNLAYANRWVDVCGTGAARGLWDCRDKNAGDEYELIYDPTQLQAGDWIIFNGGQYGHVGMAMGPFNDGYVALLGENQGGSACNGGGAAANIINMSTKTFLGAFRPKAYIVPEPEPQPDPVIPITGCLEWYVNKGDTMSGIMLSCEGTVVYGEAMNKYADSWVSRYIKPGQTVYQGWKSASGVGLYATDTIDHKIGD